MKQENKETEDFATDEDEENTKADLLILDPDDEVGLAKILENALKIPFLKSDEAGDESHAHS